MLLQHSNFLFSDGNTDSRHLLALCYHLLGLLVRRMWSSILAFWSSFKQGRWLDGARRCWFKPVFYSCVGRLLWQRHNEPNLRDKAAEVLQALVVRRVKEITAIIGQPYDVKRIETGVISSFVES